MYHAPTGSNAKSKGNSKAISKKSGSVSISLISEHDMRERGHMREKKREHMHHERERA